MCIAEADPLAGQTVDMRCLDFGRAITTQIAITHIIRHDEDDIGFVVILGHELIIIKSVYDLDISHFHAQTAEVSVYFGSLSG